MEVRIDGGGSSSDGLEQKMPVPVENVQAVAPHVLIADERLGKSGPVLMGETMRGEVVGVDVSGGRSEERRRLEEDDLFRGYEFCKVCNDVCL